MSKPSPFRLSPISWQILFFLWEHGPSKAQAIYRHLILLETEKTQLSFSKVKGILDVLIQSGYLQANAADRTYSPAVPRFALDRWYYRWASSLRWRLLSLLKPGRAVNGRDTVSLGDYSSEGPGVSLDTLVSADRFTRYTDITFPDEVSLEQPRIPLIVGLTVQPVKGGRSSEPLPLASLDPVEMIVRPTSGHFAVLGESHGSIPLYPDRDSPPITFYLKPLRSGKGYVTLDFRQTGRYVGGVVLDALVTENIGASGRKRAIESASLTLSTFSPPPPDVELRVRVLGDDSRRLAFELTWRDHYRHQPMGEIRLTTNPSQFFQILFDDLQQMAINQVDPVPTIEERLNTIGRNLYIDLFPTDLKRAYHRFREDARSMLVVSDDPWIPWELIKPYDDSILEEIVDDPFLCEKFLFARWLAGPGLLGSVPISALGCVAPQSNLQFVKRETAYLGGLQSRFPALQVSLPFPHDIHGALSLIEQGNFNLLHFACHGNFDSQRPDESSIILTDGRLRPSDIVGPRRTKLSQTHPFIFLNACQSGRVGFSLTGLGGWADRFVRAGCSAFVGTAWEVNDWLAAEFAEAFYEELWKGEPFGQAIQSARQQIKKLDASDPTWLAYTLFADPHATVEIRKKAG